MERNQFDPLSGIAPKTPEPWFAKWFGRYGRIHSAWRVLLGRLDPYDGY
jgi:hypothetical protein